MFKRNLLKSAALATLLLSREPDKQRIASLAIIQKAIAARGKLRLTSPVRSHMNGSYSSRLKRIEMWIRQLPLVPMLDSKAGSASDAELSSSDLAFRTRVIVASTLLILPMLTVDSVKAQTAQEDRQETAKAADTISPYGVSYSSGAFIYSVPLFTIGNGEWPNKISVSLNYDSSGSRPPNSAWSFSTSVRASGQFLHYAAGFEGEPLEEYHRYGANFVFGNQSSSFELGDHTLNQTNFEAASLDGSSLTREGNLFIVTDKSGNKLQVKGGVDQTVGVAFASVLDMQLANGEFISFGGNYFLGNIPALPRTSMGLRITLEPVNILSSTVSQIRICAYNLAEVELVQTADCSKSSAVATIRYERFAGSWLNHVTQVIRADGSIYNFEYESYTGGATQFGDIIHPSKTRHHLSCVKEPGQSACAVKNTYNPCDGPGYSIVYGTPQPEDSEWSGSRDRVLRQEFPDGKVVTYSQGRATSCRGLSSVVMKEGDATTTVELLQQGFKGNTRVVSSLTDPLQRTVSYKWVGENPSAGSIKRNHLISEIVHPEGNKVEYKYDLRGNLIETRIKPKDQSDSADIVTAATYPTSCPSQKTCNKPSSITDPNGKTSLFTYDLNHGGLATVTRPAAGGVNPATKYFYVQREAWLKSGSGYAKTGTPIWLLSEQRTCRTTALDLTNGTCAGGSDDLVRTIYDYGPNSGPNNLWLRGIAVTANGTTLRTCYGYDGFGRKISETWPAAGLTSCS